MCLNLHPHAPTQLVAKAPKTTHKLQTIQQAHLLSHDTSCCGLQPGVNPQRCEARRCDERERYLRIRGGLGGGASHLSSSEFWLGFSGLPSSWGSGQVHTKATQKITFRQWVRMLLELRQQEGSRWGQSVSYSTLLWPWPCSDSGFKLQSVNLHVTRRIR